MGNITGVHYLETQKLLDATKTLDQCIQSYNETVKNVSGKTTGLLQSWHGEGKTEFEKDYNTIYRQLSDISDIMYELYDALVDAAASYVEADEATAKSMTV